MKTLLKILLIVALAAVLLFVAGRYGWRLRGFAACDNASANFVETVTEENGMIRIDGGTADSFSAYVGSVHALSGGNLYVGIKHNAFLGFLQRLGGFSLAIPTEGLPVNAIYFKDNDEERLIWTREDGVIRNVPVSDPQGEDAGDDPAAAE